MVFKSTEMCFYYTSVFVHVTFAGKTFLFKRKLLLFADFGQRNAAPVPGHFGPKPFWPRTPPPKYFFYCGFSFKTAFSGNNFDFGTSIEVKRSVSEYHNQNRTVRENQSQGVSQLNKGPGSETNKSTVREYNNETECM